MLKMAGGGGAVESIGKWRNRAGQSSLRSSVLWPSGRRRQKKQKKNCHSRDTNTDRRLSRSPWQGGLFQLPSRTANVTIDENPLHSCSFCRRRACRYRSRSPGQVAQVWVVVPQRRRVMGSRRGSEEGGRAYFTEGFRARTSLGAERLPFHIVRGF